MGGITYGHVLMRDIEECLPGGLKLLCGWHLMLDFTDGEMAESWMEGDRSYWKPGVCLLWPFSVNEAP